MLKKWPLLIATATTLGICCGGVLIGVYAMSPHHPVEKSHQAPQPPEFQLPEIALGDPNAPHTVIMYFALDCAHCREYEDKTLPIIKEKFIDTGKLRFILRDFSSNPLGLLASQVSWARRNPEDYLAMVKKLFAGQAEWNVPSGYKEKLMQVSGLTEQEFDDCVNDADLEHAILWQHLQAKEINEVPTFIIDGEPIKDILTPDVFIAFLAKKQKNS